MNVVQKEQHNLCNESFMEVNYTEIWLVHCGILNMYTDKSCCLQFVLLSPPNPNLVRKYMKRMEESAVLNK